MLSFSHVEVANYFYPKLKSDMLGFNLNKKSFFKGNVLPDKQRHKFNAHYYAESKPDCEYYLSRANDESLNDEERSEALGVVCHFMCDYFCKYHSLEHYKKDKGIKHFLYEAQLHITLKSVQIRRSLNKLSFAEERLFTAHDLSKLVGDYADIELLMKEYFDQTESLVNDLTFAFAAVRGVLIQSFNADFTQKEENIYDSLMNRYLNLSGLSLKKELSK